MRKWVLLLTCQYCFKWKANTVQPSFYLVLDILHMLKNGGVGHSGLNTAGSFLSSFVTIEDYVAGKHTLVCKYVKVSYKKINSFQNIDLLGCGLSYKLSWHYMDRHFEILFTKNCYFFNHSLEIARYKTYHPRRKLITLEENYIVISTADALKTTSKRYHKSYWRSKNPTLPFKQSYVPCVLLEKVFWICKTDERQYYFITYNVIEIIQTSVKRHYITIKMHKVSTCCSWNWCKVISTLIDLIYFH